jgi:hypothetical protein
MVVLNKVLKPNLIEKHTRMRAYKILARSVPICGSEAWKVCKRDGSRMTAAGMKFVRRSAGNSVWTEKEIRM